jgi:thymidylate kinase
MAMVELFGLPGSGKTSVGAVTAQLLRARGLRVAEAVAAINQRGKAQRAAIKLQHAAFAALASPAAAARLVSTIWASRQQSSSAAARNLVNLLLQRSLAAGPKTNADVVLCDQGVLQALWSLNLEAENPRPLRSFYELVASPAAERLVVYLDVDAESVVKRLLTRADRGGRFARAIDASSGSGADCDRLAEQSWQLARSIADHNPAITLVRVPNHDGRIDAAAEETADAVSGFLDRRKSSTNARPLRHA